MMMMRRRRSGCRNKKVGGGDVGEKRYRTSRNNKERIAIKY